MTDRSHATTLAEIGEVIADAAEETFILFSQDLPQNDLGMVDDKASNIDLNLNGKDFTIHQSSSLLKSSRKAGTTGAMVWKVTPRVAEWLGHQDSILWKTHLLTSSTTVVELGCGVAGLIGLALAPSIASYVLTDQAYVLKLLKENIAANRTLSRPTRKVSKMMSNHDVVDAAGNLFVMPLDWEHDSVKIVQQHLQHDAAVDVLILCDCIFNSFLIEPLTQTCIDICRMNSSRSTMVLIAQQLRSDQVFEEWLSTFLRAFDVWRISDDMLPSTLQSSSGYVVHTALLK